MPEYRLAESGPDHAKSFTAVVLVVGGEPCGEGAGRSKKEAEQQAAARARSEALADDGPEAASAGRA